MVSRPENNEFNPYYIGYVDLVPDGEITSILSRQLDDMQQLLMKISEKQGEFRYASNKWSLKEVIGHVTDTERIMSYRLLCVARGEQIALPGFNENQYVDNADFNNQTMEELLENLTVVRQSTILLLKSLKGDIWLRKGNVNDSEVTVRALAYIIAGHQQHHFQIIKERYLKAEQFPH